MISPAFLAVLRCLRPLPPRLAPPLPRLAPPSPARFARAAIRQHSTPPAPAEPLALRGKMFWLLNEDAAWLPAVVKAVVEARSEVQAEYRKPHKSTTNPEHTNIVQVRLWQDRSKRGMKEKDYAMHVWETGKWQGDWQ